MFGAIFPIVLVLNPAVPARSLAELIRLVKASPGKFSYSSSGNGGGTHLAGELLIDKLMQLVEGGRAISTVLPTRLIVRET